jgi:hypothetical protein
MPLDRDLEIIPMMATDSVMQLVARLSVAKSV